jgi:hypothetical protein
VNEIAVSASVALRIFLVDGAAMAKIAALLAANANMVLASGLLW